MRKPLTPEQKEAAAKRQKAWREANKEHLAKWYRDYRKANPESNKTNTKNYRKNNPETAKASSKKYKTKNKEKVKEYREKYKERKNELVREKRKNNPIYKLAHLIRGSINKALARNGFKKNSRTHEVLGCTYEFFKDHIEVQFQSWMTWNNHGLYNGEFDYGWDLDHIEPISNAINEADVIRLSHYTNFQPLCSKVNRDIKRNNHTV